MPPRKSSPSKAKASPKKRTPTPTRRIRTRSSSRSRSSTASVQEESVEVVKKSRSVGRKPAAAKTDVAPPVPPRAASRSPARTKAVTGDWAQSRSKTTVLQGVTTSSRSVDTVDGKTTTTTKMSRMMVSSQGDLSAPLKPSLGPTNPSGAPGNLMSLVLMVGTTALVYYLMLACTKKSCTIWKLPRCPAQLNAFFKVNPALMTLAYYLIAAALYMLPIGDIVAGPKLRDGFTQLNYRCNAWFSMSVAVVAVGYGIYIGSPMDFVENDLLAFVTSSVILSLVLSVWAAVRARNLPQDKRSINATGGLLNDFFMGRELHPRIGDLDIKYLLVRAGTILWVIIDWLYLASKFEKTGVFDPALSLLVLGHTTYTAAFMLNEELILSSMDLASEGFGFMTALGATVFFPFCNSITTRFLYHHPEAGLQNRYLLALHFCFHVIGLVMIFGSNRQKCEFRKNAYHPALGPHDSIRTAIPGKRLLCCGWWGLIRRPNYLADLILAWTWSLMCGVDFVFPYFYPVVLTSLLVSRCLTDEAAMSVRYGSAWIEYTQRVRWRLIPFIF